MTPGRAVAVAASAAVLAVSLIAAVTVLRGTARVAGAFAQRPPEPFVQRVVGLTASAPRAGYAVRFAGPRADARAEIDRAVGVITIFVRPGDPVHRVAHDLAHELGHAYDDRRLSDADRAAYLRRRGVAGTPWWPRGAHSDLRSGAGDFAEVFARCHAASPDFRSEVAAVPADACAILPEGARPR